MQNREVVEWIQVGILSVRLDPILDFEQKEEPKRTPVYWEETFFAKFHPWSREKPGRHRA